MRTGATVLARAVPRKRNVLCRSPMYEFQVLATFAVIGGIYFSLFIAYEKLFLK